MEQPLFQFIRNIPRNTSGNECLLDFDGTTVRARVVRNPKARHYRLSIDTHGAVRLVIPRGGSLGQALGFAKSKAAWAKRILSRTLDEGHAKEARLMARNEVLFGGVVTPFSILHPSPGTVVVSIGEDRFALRTRERDPRRLLTIALWSHARRVLPPQLRGLAAKFLCDVGRVTVRNQRSRWGSCAADGNISLNWRLVQMPAAIAEYVMIHELMHRRVLSHSPKFWREVAGACPGYKEAERWLKDHRTLLLS